MYGNVYSTPQSDKSETFRFHAVPFWKKRPDLWFKKLEAQLSNLNIEDDQKQYNFLISVLDEEIALEVKDVLLAPPRYRPYKFLKEQLMKRIAVKNEEEAMKIMMVEPMGDRAPSEFYNYLNILADCYVRDGFVEEIWLECLPSKIQSVIKCLKEFVKNTNILKTVADRIHLEFIKEADLPVQQSQDTTSTHELMENLVKEVEILNKKVKTLKPKVPPYTMPSKCKDIKSTSSKSQVKTVIQQKQCTPCEYHTKYGVKLCKMSKNCN